MNVLDEIVSNTRAEVDARKSDLAYVQSIEDGVNASKSRISRDLTKPASGNAIIAELKLSSPSSGVALKPDTNIPEIIRDYTKGGASALSILTERKYFKGSLDYLKLARENSNLPILRKDFIIDTLQINEARAYGADGILLISCILGNSLKWMLDYAHELGLWCLVETHTESEIMEALDVGARIIGINNRNLRTLQVDLENTVRLSSHVPSKKILVVESGINNANHIKYFKINCSRKPDAFLVGTSLMTAKNRVEKLRELVNA